jgi:hypothetical protein
VADGDFLYLRWTGNDVLGSGSRDEYGLDNIQVTALMAVEPPTTPPSSIVPEPSSGITCSLLALFGLGLSSWTRRRRAVRGSAAPAAAS